ncbi:MAG: S-methyl-5-thioribose-1-phosphate isomerase [Pseudomonadales bacterium]|nr:S-methyl-5-thioribose-1-phosphate isomerase [Pseudomonadales bacterium]
MLLNGVSHRTITVDSQQTITIIDQTRLPFSIEWLKLETVDAACIAIKTMQVRGAPAIGAVAAYAMVLAVKEDASWQAILQAAQSIKATRPTAVNLAWAVDKQLAALCDVEDDLRLELSWQLAADICEEDVAACSAIGDYGLALIEKIAAQKPGQTINILTHCNAGWLATVDWGTALSPIYKAQQKGLPIHVWVDETRPRNQGALLTAFELSQQGINNTLICDNAGGHLMQTGQVDLCLVGSDRTTSNGNVCNKIGTYLKALAAKDNNIPFYVALPTSTIDWILHSGNDIPIEERDASEVLNVMVNVDGELQALPMSAATQAANPAFDVTPAHLVTALITEKGVYAANTEALQRLKDVCDK